MYMITQLYNIISPLQPRTLNIQASIDARSSGMAKIQGKINKVEDEVPACIIVAITYAHVYIWCISHALRDGFIVSTSTPLLVGVS